MKGLLKYLIMLFLRLFVRIFYIFPIKSNRLLFFSYKGTQYSDSPMYVSKELVKQFGTRLQIIWAFKKKKDYKFLTQEGIKLVKYYSIKRVYYECTSKICINNIGSYSWLPSRKGQEHINTWHGGGAYKRCALGEVKNNKYVKKTFNYGAKETSCFLSSCKIFSDKVLKDDFNYSGFTLNIGLPRNDCFFDQKHIDNISDKLRKIYNLENKSVILYAPTWRYEETGETIDPERILSVFNKKYDRQFVFLYRGHHLSKTNLNFDFVENRIIDVTDYSNMQDLLCLADFLITDYSSCIWDFALMHKPIYLYVPDLSSYISNRGFHVTVTEYGFPYAEDNSELCKLILDDSLENAYINAEQHLKMLGSYESGFATEKTVNFIKNKLTID